MEKLGEMGERVKRACNAVLDEWREWGEGEREEERGRGMREIEEVYEEVRRVVAEKREERHRWLLNHQQQQQQQEQAEKERGAAGSGPSPLFLFPDSALSAFVQCCG